MRRPHGHGEDDAGREGGARRPPGEIHSRVLAVFAARRDGPKSAGPSPLRGNLAGQFRVRTGDYRVQFSPTGRGRGAVVIVSKIGRRDGFCDE